LFTGEPRGFQHMGSATVLAVVQWHTQDGETGWGQYDWHGNLYQQKKRRPRNLSGPGVHWTAAGKLATVTD
jgi:hypothetical protein